MDAEERLHQKRMGYVKYCILVTEARSVKGQIVVKTCQSGSVKYIKYLDIEREVEGQMEKWQSNKKTHRNDCEQSRDGTKTKK